MTATRKATGVPVQLVKAKIDRVDGVDGPANEVPFLVMKAATVIVEGDDLGADMPVEVEDESPGIAPAEVQPGETPGDSAWEKQDAATAQKAAAIVAQLRGQVEELISRELAENETADVWSLQDAMCGLDWVLGTLAKFSFEEQAEADAAAEKERESDAGNEAGDGSATDEEEADTVTKSVTTDDVSGIVAAALEERLAPILKAVEALAQPSAPADEETSTEPAATAAEPVEKQSDTDVSEVLKSTLPQALEPVTKAVGQLAELVAGVSERLAKVEAQDALAGPLLKGAHVQAAHPQSHLWGQRPNGDPYAAHLPGGIETPEQLSKAVEAISDPRARDEAGRAIALASHPLFSNKQ